MTLLLMTRAEWNALRGEQQRALQLHQVSVEYTLAEALEDSGRPHEFAFELTLAELHNVTGSSGGEGIR